LTDLKKKVVCPLLCPSVIKAIRFKGTATPF